MAVQLPLLPTSLVGSYAQPSWLIDRDRLGQRLPPRVLLDELWRVGPANLPEAHNDATVVALGDQHRGVRRRRERGAARPFRGRRGHRAAR